MHAKGKGPRPVTFDPISLSDFDDLRKRLVELASSLHPASDATAEMRAFNTGLICGVAVELVGRLAAHRAAGDALAEVLQRYQKWSQTFETEGRAVLAAWEKAKGEGR